MTRNIIFTNLALLSLTSVACDFVADFSPKEFGASGADAGGKAGRGGANQTGLGGSASNAGNTVGGTPGAGSAAGSSSGGTTSTQSRGGSAGTVTTSSGGVAGAGAQALALGSAGSVGAALGGTSNAGGGTTFTNTGGAAASVGGALAGSPGVGGAKATAGNTSSGAAGRGGASSTGGVTSTGGAASIPSVISISPATGAKGVPPDATVQIVFSEPMTASSVEAALSISSLTSSELTLKWSDSNTRLTITPSGGFLPGTDLRSNTYTVTLGGGAKDLDGTSIAAAFTSSFVTVRRFQRLIEPEQVAEYTDYGAFYLHEAPILCIDSTLNIPVGSWSGSYSSGTEYNYVSWNVASIGSPTAVRKIEWAKILATQVAQSGDFYSTGYVFVERLTYSPMESISTIEPAIETLGVLASAATTTYASLEITSRFASLFAAGQTRFLFRVAHAGNPPSNTAANFTCGGYGLSLSYLAE